MTIFEISGTDTFVNDAGFYTSLHQKDFSTQIKFNNKTLKSKFCEIDLNLFRTDM